MHGSNVFHLPWYLWQVWAVKLYSTVSVLYLEKNAACQQKRLVLQSSGIEPGETQLLTISSNTQDTEALTPDYEFQPKVLYFILNWFALGRGARLVNSLLLSLPFWSECRMRWCNSLCHQSSSTERADTVRLNTIIIYHTFRGHQLSAHHGPPCVIRVQTTLRVVDVQTNQCFVGSSRDHPVGYISHYAHQPKLLSVSNSLSYRRKSATQRKSAKIVNPSYALCAVNR